MFAIDGTGVAREIVYTAAFAAGAVACLVVGLAALAIKSTPTTGESVVGGRSEPAVPAGSTARSAPTT
ncbi:MAG: hypothetical protein QME72_07980 [Rhodococcus sp. (in: high G+C Gram-positive bacteria)]|nr:hypothetical protein [Rhodococcus sp. (in: high G+C Gram-positive bacteria)]MDI6627641.1 hypothetical protein [Rhodococcus sp. (in: high G+C Gram-positive bacteria)]